MKRGNIWWVEFDSSVGSEINKTRPQDIRVKMNIKKGDKIVFVEDNGKYFLQNTASTALQALEEIQNSMKGEAKKAGFNNPDDVVKYIKSLRKAKSK